MGNIEWIIVVVGWTVILVTLSITKLKIHRCGGGIYTMENKLLHKQKWLVRGFCYIYMVLIGLISLKAYFPAFDDIQDVSRYFFITIGVLLFAIAIVMYVAARYIISSNCTWKGDFIRDRNKLIKRGIYSLIRHPHYTSYFTAGIATGLILTDSRILAFMFLLLPCIYYKSLIEEQYLEMIFKEYLEYKKKTKMFF